MVSSLPAIYDLTTTASSAFEKFMLYFRSDFCSVCKLLGFMLVGGGGEVGRWWWPGEEGGCER